MPPRWSILQIQSSDQEAVARVCLDEPGDFPRALAPTRVMVNWDYGGDGFPDSSATQLIDSFESLLDDLSADNGNSYLMLVLTGSGRKQWVYYVRDLARFMASVNTALAGQERFPIALHEDADPDWEYWFAFASRAQEGG